MKKPRLLHNLTVYAWNVICQQFWLLAVLSMLFLLLSVCAGPAAEKLLSQGVEFSGITLAVCTPEGDDTGLLLQELTGNMRDVSQYARLISMEQEDAIKALDAGEVTAVLLLPENFVEGILSGSNPDVTLVVSGDRPLEALLTLWVGQSAADLLSAAQQGIYAVLDVYAQNPPAGLTRQQAVMQINMKYINQTLTRQEIFRFDVLSASDTMDISSHYGLTLLVFLGMALSPAFCPLFSRRDIPFRIRLKTLGCGAGKQLIGIQWVMFCSLVLMTALPALVLSRWNPAGVLVFTVFTCAYCSFCCLMTRTTAGCGALSLGLGAAAVYVSGGLIPAPLLPDVVRQAGELSPVWFLRKVLYLSPEEWGSDLYGILVWTAILLLASRILLGRRLNRREAAV